MANRESGDYRRDRNFDREFQGGEFRGGAEEREGRGREGSRSFGRGYDESGREMQFGREHEAGERNQGWQSGSQRYGSGYGQSPEWSQGGYSGSQRDREFGREWSASRDFGGERYGYPSGSQFGQGRYGYGESFERGSEGIDRSERFSGGPSYGSGRYGQEFGRGSYPYRPGFEGFDRETGGYGQTGGYSEERFGTPGRARGRFTGRGPKGYTRSDDRIKEDVSDRLEQHGEIDAWEIVVMVQNGEVTLEGTVPDRRTKRLAEDVAEDSPGVRQVHNRLRVQSTIGEGEGSRTHSTSTQSGQTVGSSEGSDRSRSTSTKSTART